MDRRTMFYSESHYGNRSHFAITAKQEALNTLIIPSHLTWSICDKKRSTLPDGIMNFTMAAINIKYKYIIKYVNQQKHLYFLFLALSVTSS